MTSDVDWWDEDHMAELRADRDRDAQDAYEDARPMCREHENDNCDERADPDLDGYCAQHHDEAGERAQADAAHFYL